MLMKGPPAVAPYCHWYDYAPGPPAGAVASVSVAGLSPLQRTWSAAIDPGVRSAGWVMIIVLMAVQFLASVTLTEIEPAPAAKNDCELKPGAASTPPVVLDTSVNV